MATEIATSGSLSLWGHRSLDTGIAASVFGHHGDLLRPDEVVFYHPLDNAWEYTQARKWDGAVQFGSGVVGSGAVGLPEFASLGASGSISGSFSYCRLDGLLGIDSTRALCCYGISTTASRICVVGISGDVVTSGNSVQVAHSQYFHEATIAKLSNDKFVAVVDRNGLYASVVSVSGYTVSLGSEQYVGPRTYYPSAAGLDTERVMVIGAQVPPGGKVGGVVFEVSGTTVSSWGDVFDIDGSVPGYPDGKIVPLDASRVAITYGETSSSNVPLYAAVVDVAGTSGNVVTSGVLVADEYWNSLERHGCFPVKDPTNPSGFVAIYDRDDGQICPAFARVCSVSGSTINVGPSGQLHAKFGDNLSAVVLNDTDIGLVATAARPELGSDAGVDFRVLRMDGSGLIVFPATFVLDTHGNPTLPRTPIARLQDNRVLALVDTDLPGNEARLYEIMAQPASGLSHSGIDIYPSVSGATRLTAAMWVRNPTTSGGVITLERGHRITLEESGIQLGSGTATWNGPGVETVLSGVNDGQSHLLVLDFEHQTGTTWALRTSTDGSGWMSHGAQTSGSASIAAQDTPPSLFVLPGVGSGDYTLDEVVLWRGGELFSAQELSNLHELASVHNQPMNEYGSYYDAYTAGQAPLHTKGHERIEDEIGLHLPAFEMITASEPLYVKSIGTVSGAAEFRVTGVGGASQSFSLFMQAALTTSGQYPPASGIWGWGVAELVRTHDHHPQVIGLLDYVGTSGEVDITVYELTNMTEVSLGHSRCYPIGDTGRWGWSTAYLPGDTKYGQHFVYRMATSGAAQTFAGEFFLRFPASDRR